jgi:hypothetical protein
MTSLNWTPLPEQRSSYSNTNSEKTTKMKSIPFIGYIGVFAALALLLASCNDNKDLPDNERSGQLIPVHIRSLGMAESASEDFTRSASQEEPETVILPLGDGTLLEASIEQTQSSLRGLVNLKTGAHFRVIAVETSTNRIYTYGDFVYGGSNSIPTFYVHVGDEYYFICISHNDETVFDTSSAYNKGATLPSFSVGSTKDMLWWKSPNITVTADADIALDIKLEQKLAKINLIVDCTYNERKISGVDGSKITVRNVNTSGSLNLSTGVASSSVTATSSTLVWTAPETPYPSEHPSNGLTVIPRESSTITVTLQANAISRDGLSAIPAAQKTLQFVTALSVGNEYTIRIKLRTPKLAGSNIYWEWYEDEDGNPDTHTAGGHLTFDPYQEDGSQAPHKGHQGVFFKYGSLVGISPITNYTTPVSVYIPDGDDWAATTIATYADIPAWGDANTSSYNVTAINATYKDELLGDICSCIDSDYRLPKFGEFGTTNTNWAGNADGWVPVGGYGNTSTTLSDGTYDVISNGHGYTTNSRMDGVRLPTTGFTYDNGGLSVTLGTGGYYRTGSATATNNNNYMNFDAANFYSNNFVGTRQYGMAVRCVMN